MRSISRLSLSEADVNPDNLEQATLKVVIQAASLSVKDDISDKDRREIERMMQQEILELDLPGDRYEGSGIAATKAGEGQYSVTLNGDLSMHGVTRPQMVPARVA